MSKSIITYKLIQNIMYFHWSVTLLHRLEMVTNVVSVD